MNRRSSTAAERIAFGVILAAVVCLCAVLIVPGVRRLHSRLERNEALTGERDAELARKLRAEREIQELSTDEGIERVARQDLHLVKEGEVVFDFGPAQPSDDGRQ